MKITWWLDLNSDAKRLLAGCFIVISVLAGTVVYLFKEIGNTRTYYEAELKTERTEKLKILAEKEASKAASDREKFDMVQDLYKEQKALNEKQVAINDKQREENARQQQINMQNRKTTESTKSTIQQIKAVITD